MGERNAPSSLQIHGQAFLVSVTDPYRNQLLAALPPADYDAAVRSGSLVSVPARAILCEAENLVNDVFFPIAGMISLVVMLNNGKAIETGVVGSDGVFGAMAGLGIRVTHVRALVRMPLTALVIPQRNFRKLAESRNSIFLLCVRYNEVLLNQARVTAACSSLHPLNARFCRWLLQSSDRAGEVHFQLTHASMSELLGVRRTSITEIASMLQNAGIIKYSRGNITILDRARLQAMSCGCDKTPVFSAF